MQEFLNEAMVEGFTFYRVPKVLFTEPEFRKISAEARILYGLLLDRLGLSMMNNWHDDKGRVYIYFKIEEVCECLGCAKQKAVKLMAELDQYGLIERKGQGKGRPNKIYVKSFKRKTE